MDFHKFQFGAMASLCELSFHLDNSNLAFDLAREVELEVRRIEKKFSRFLQSSVVGLINQSKPNVPIPCDDETIWLLGLADKFYKKSHGLFDITAGSLYQVWDFKRGILPSADVISEALKKVGWQHVAIDEHHITLLTPNIQIDLGGIGKEYAVDCAAKILKNAGVRSGIVNFAGDINVIGPKDNGDPWIVGVQHPRSQSALVTSLPVYEGGFATSGDYARFFIKDGARYAHILNPLTGYPAGYWQSVSVLASTTVDAGFLSTTTILKETLGLDFLVSEKVPFYAIDFDGNVHIGSSKNV